MTRARDVATQGGLVLLNKTDFSSASSVALQSVFTDAYVNYRIDLNIQPVSGTSRYMNWRMMNGATENTDLTYYWGYQGIRYGTVTTQSTAGVENSALAVLYGNNNPASAYLNIFNPKQAYATMAHGGQFGHDGTNFAWMDLGWFHNTATAFDGIKMFFSVAASGTVRLYGYK